MWDSDPEDPTSVQHLFSTTQKKVGGMIFQPQKDYPVEGEDIGLDTATPPKK